MSRLFKEPSPKPAPTIFFCRAGLPLNNLQYIYTGIYQRQPMTFIEKICQRFAEFKVPYAVVGGYAVALHGAPRGTIDVDVIISLKEPFIEAAEKALLSLGLRSLLPITAHDLYEFRIEYIKNRNLVAWSFYNPTNPMEIVDIIITHNLDDCSFITIKLANAEINIVSKSDLIKMKKLSSRAQDLHDIEALQKL